MALKFQRQGRLLTFAPSIGEEALQVATSMAMDKKNDFFVPGYRVNAALLEMGVPQELLLLYWNGNEKGSKFPEHIRSLPLNITIGCQYSHASGVAYALKQQGVLGAAITFIGNGGTSEGEFYEAMNIAAVHKWPVVFCVNNNQWAISTPESESTAAATIAIKSVAVGIPGIRLDGNDVVASYEGMMEALDYARSKGPILVEFLTYRKGPHTTSDDPKIYRTKKMEEEGNAIDPIIRLKKFLANNKEIKLTPDQDQIIYDEARQMVTTSFKKMEEMNKVSIDDVFDYTYEELTQELKEQKEQCIKEHEGKK